MERSSRTRLFDDGSDCWSVIDALPAPSLLDDVASYGWWAERTATFDTRRELAGTRGTLIVNLASDLHVTDVAGTVTSLPAGDGFIAGLSQGTSLSRSTGPMAGIHVRAPLTTLARIAGTSVADLTDHTVPIAELPALRSLHPGQRLLEAETDEARWSVLDDMIATRLAATAGPSPELGRLTAGLASGVRVDTLAYELGWSRKRLARTFSDALGLHPRAFAGLARFGRFASRLQATPGIPLVDVALAAGYADQAHLTREVRRFADVTPAALRRRLLPAGGGVRD